MGDQIPNLNPPANALRGNLKSLSCLLDRQKVGEGVFKRLICINGHGVILVRLEA